MSLTVKFNGPRLLGKLPPSRVPYVINGTGGLQIGSLSDYLNGLFGNWKQCLSDGLKRFSYVNWNGSQNQRDSLKRELLIRVICPIFESGRIPDHIPQNDIQAMGVTSIEDFEMCLFDLINELIALDDASHI